ncbi:hypothetical protein MSAR_31950 [Mycolicibacterium sarraceniae]|uniref:Uncharacterized protein n=1 Tax=Mycolicibacterium sarraceniae TaxID=1534348 RepID=A0A7I7SV58_9MYCO|nr:hypothetical protein MSAR_31950 [Mycolicibacterium sarraceniae]
MRRRFGSVDPDGDALALLAAGGVTTMSPTSAGNACSSESKVASLPRGTMIPAWETIRQVRRLLSHRLIATAEVYSLDDSRVQRIADQAPPGG